MARARFGGGEGSSGPIIAEDSNFCWLEDFLLLNFTNLRTAKIPMCNCVNINTITLG